MCLFGQKGNLKTKYKNTDRYYSWEKMKKISFDISINFENLNQTKDKFFNIIAHDLRNPFAGILGISELLETKLKDLPSGSIRGFK